MTDRLHALVDQREVGVISQEPKSGRLGFEYADDWRDDPGGFPISLNLPLSGRQHDHGAVEAFIVGLLPDNPVVLDEWARRFQVSPRNPFRLLAHVGEDCAGAIQFVESRRLDSLRESAEEGRINWLTEAQLKERIELLMSNHGATRLDDTEGQFSLAGAQPKIALYREEASGKWGIPSGPTPTTHILKPCDTEMAEHATNEHFCLRLAKRLGFVTTASEIRRFGDRSVLILKRYDRIQQDGRVKRVHQEDMCQSLGVHPRLKYQREGGPGPEEILDHIQENSSNPRKDRERFVDALIFNFLIGGTDAHAKNYSFLIASRGQVRLAPLYDIASIFPYPQIYNARKTRLAMKIGNRYKLCEIGRDAWEKSAINWRFGGEALRDRIRELAEQIPEASKGVVSELESRGEANSVIHQLSEMISEHAGKEADRFSG